MLGSEGWMKQIEVLSCGLGSIISASEGEINYLLWSGSWQVFMVQL